MAELSHVDESSGAVKMVDVGAKPLSRRRATARGVVQMAPETARRLRELPKGDALATAQLAGIMAAKRTSELIPLCHPLPLTHVEVELVVGDGVVEIVASAETTAQTGVEMEALTAVTVAALTLYDMAKAIDKQMVITEIRLVEKTKVEAVKAAVLTVSDRVAGGRWPMRAATRSTSCCSPTGTTSSGASFPTTPRTLRRHCASSPAARRSC